MTVLGKILFGRTFDNGKAVESFVRGLLTHETLADVDRVIYKRAPNASAWARIQEHAAKCGVPIFLHVTGQDKTDGAWIDRRIVSLADALAVRNNELACGHISGVTFQSGYTWLEIADDAVELFTESGRTDVHAWNREEFFKKLHAAAMQLDAEM